MGGSWYCSDFVIVGSGAVNLFPVPYGVPEAVAVRELSCGADHTLLLGYDGRVFVRGKNDYGQLGLAKLPPSTGLFPSTIDRVVVRFTELEISGGAVSTIACGGFSSAALNEDGLWIWGSNSHGQTGRGYPSRKEPKPQKAVLNSKHQVHGHMIRWPREHWQCSQHSLY